MATVINNPSNEGSGAGTIIGIVVAIILIALLFIYGLPALRGSGTTSGANNTPGASANVDVSLPGGTSGSGSGGTGGTGTGQ